MPACAYLKLLGPRTVRIRVEADRPFVIGRAPECELSLDDRLVSRHHCELRLTDRGLEVRDLKSRNGTTFNGERLKTPVVAQPGDQIKIGSSYLIVEGERAETTPGPRPAGEVVPGSGPIGAPGEAGDGGSAPTPPQARPPSAAVPRGASTSAATPGPGPALAAGSTPAAGTASVGGGAAAGPGAGRGAAAASSSPPPPPPSIPGYEILRELVRHPTGRTFHARSLLDGREVAIKVLETARAAIAVKKVVARFQREARALSRLDHPNIVRIFDVDKVASTHFYVTEYVEGKRLADRIREAGRLGVREALSIAIQVARALDLAAQAGVVHRDITPANILITAAGIAKLTDFGFVKSTAGPEEGEQDSVTSLGEMVGDLRYSSPEQTRDPRTVDHRSDLYSLGATLFHCLAGAPPFGGENYLETIRMVLATTPAPLRDAVPETPPKVEKIVQRLLQKDPADRFATAPEVVVALEDALLDACGAPEAPPSDERDARSDSAIMNGTFGGMELVEIVQFLEWNRKDGTLVVSAPPLEGELVFREGEIVAAAAGRLDGREAVLGLLSAAGGTFRFRGEKRSGVPGFRMKPSLAAVEAMRLRDEQTGKSEATLR